MDRVRDKERVRRVASAQAGRIARWQLRHLDVSDDRVRSWVESAYLMVVLPKVFAVGHRAASREGDLWAAVLYAGPNAAVSHATAAALRGLIDYPPKRTEVSSPRKIRSLPCVRVYGRRCIKRVVCKGIPVTSVAQTMLDLAAVAELKLVRKALARLDYWGLLDVAALQEICGRGKPGSRVLLEALEIHQPRLAHTNGRLEDDFLVWCETRKLPLPLVNVRVYGILVDAYWPQHGVVVELDGLDNHRTATQLRRDKANDLELRRHGLIVLRYDWTLVHDHARDVHRDLTRALGAT